jgi:predicted tellurium resistance membrane protein TerC
VVGFLAFVAATLALDLGVFHRDAHAVTRREALAWSGVWAALAVAFAGVELTDVAFAVDSIPADLADRFRHPRTGLAAVLIYVGAKMITAPWVKVPAGLSLAVIPLILAVAVAWSILERRAGRREQAERDIARQG